MQYLHVNDDKAITRPRFKYHDYLNAANRHRKFEKQNQQP